MLYDLTEKREQLESIERCKVGYYGLAMRKDSCQMKDIICQCKISQKTKKKIYCTATT